MAKFTDSPILSDRFADALLFAHNAHLKQIRKGATETPYIAHLLAVASLVLESGGSEDEAIAALLHDSIEDVSVNPFDIQEKFGANVKHIVLDLTEADKELPKALRKKLYADAVLTMSESAVRVSIADKLHNIRSYAINPELWGQEQHDFYAQLLDSYEQRDIPPGTEELIIEISLLFEQLSKL